MAIYNKTNSDKYIDEIDQTFDSEWLKSTFIIKDSDIVKNNSYNIWIRKNRYSSTADYKFTCTSPGMNMAVNPLPQFTRYTDIRVKGKIGSREDIISINSTPGPYGLGMGRYYSEAIDDNQQRIFLRFGVPKYMPLLLWVSKAFDIDKVILNNRGVITSTLLKAIDIVSIFFAVTAAPLLAIGMFALNVYVQSSRFYSVNETMYLYWGTVESLLNKMVARRTLIPTIFKDYSTKLDNHIGNEQRITEDFISNLNSLIPDIIDAETGRISVYAIALRAQAAMNRVYIEDIEKNSQRPLSADFTSYQDTGSNSHDTYFTNTKGEENIFTRYLFKKAANLLMSENEKNLDSTNIDQTSLINIDPIYTDEDDNVIDFTEDPEDPTSILENKVNENIKNKKDKWDKYKEYLLAELTEGAGFAVFNVEYTGSIGESFSNSFSDNPLESTFNSMSSTVRSVTNTISSAAGIPIVGDVMKLAADAGATILSNATFGIANPLLALAYGVNVNLPKVWESSSSSLPRTSYKIKLISPYGNPYSQLFNIYLPLAMILAGSLPRSTGSATYTHPFYCQLFDRGRTNIQLGMIENVSITRGTSNLAFTKSGHPNAIDVDISIANMDELISVDIESNGVISKISEIVDPDFSDSPLETYLNTITGVDVYTQIYRVPAWRLKVAERAMQLKSIVNPDPAAFGSFTVNTFASPFKDLLSNNTVALQELANK
jgi:hypothetical protein